MRIAGWKTANVFKRYAIVDKSDIRTALQQLERTRQKQADSTNERNLGHEYSPLSQLPITVH
jgi:hypothetical protein